MTRVEKFKAERRMALDMFVDAVRDNVKDEAAIAIILNAGLAFAAAAMREANSEVLESIEAAFKVTP